jgi:hypothetical protein
MNKNQVKESEDDIFLRKVKKDLNIFNNLNFILEKIKKEGHFKTIKQIYLSIFSSELTFTLRSNPN